MAIADPLVILLLLISNSVIVAATCIAALRIDRKIQFFDKFWNSPAGIALIDGGREAAERQLQASLQVEQRITELQQVISLVANNENKRLSSVERSLPIEYAVRMTKHGASIEDLRQTCGLSLGEAKLMQKMHGKAQAVRPTRT